MYQFFKRGFDLTFASIGLLVLSPVFVAIAIGVRLSSPGPILYGGTRVGLRGVPFPMFKFRTMLADLDVVGPSSTASDDPRITALGKVLRRFKLDEIPQLINVLRGEMSFVGPRPQVQWAVDLYDSEERKLLSVRPGITDFASLRFRNEAEILKGSSNPDRDYLEKIAPEKIKLGLYYVRASSIVIDGKILLATLLSIGGLDPSWCLPSRSSVA